MEYGATFKWTKPGTPAAKLCAAAVLADCVVEFIRDDALVMRGRNIVTVFKVLEAAGVDQDAFDEIRTQRIGE